MRRSTRWTLALATAAVLSLGCGDSGVSNTELLDAIDGLCARALECGASTSMEACVSLNRSSEVRGECVLEAINFLNCGAALTCEQLMDPNNAACDDQLVRCAAN